MNFFRFTISFVLASLLAGYSCSSTKKIARQDYVDAQYECIWSVKFINDTIEMTQGTEDRFILQIGADFSYGYSYLYFKMDSLITARTLGEKIRESYNNGTWSSFFSGDIMYAKLYRDYKSKKLSVIDNISTYWFMYEENLSPQNWSILNEIKTIAGYSCQKAICDWRGRSYEAWFTTEIPISEGPWKFFGLPGLIVKLHDTQHHYEFELVEFKNSNGKIDLQPLEKEEITILIGRTAKLTKIERKKFLGMKFGKQASLIAQADMAKVGLQNDEPVKSKYGYIELDYK